MNRTTCRICAEDVLETRIDFGMQPVTNRYLRSPDEEQYRFRLSLAQCAACGIVQLGDPPPVNEVVPRFDWITYTEAEGHLDRTADAIASHDSLNHDSLIAGVSYKDDSLLDRLKRKGFANAKRIDGKSDLGLSVADPGMESIQQALTPERFAGLESSWGKPDAIVARHVFEHAYDPIQALKTLGGWLKPGGTLVIEIPDCKQSLDLCDYTMVWEEHILYLTESTFRFALNMAGLDVIQFHRESYPYEDALTAFATVSASPQPEPGGFLDDELSRGRRYAESLPSIARAVQHRVSGLAGEGGVALMGAGHLAASYINYFELNDSIDCVLDDDPNKQGLFMPGSALPIAPGRELAERNLKTCLLTLSPESERRVMEKMGEYQKSGGRLASIFPASPNSLVDVQP